jgi:hypothetical protein
MAANGAPSSSSSNNFPGFDYLERLSNRYALAVGGQAAEANRLWKSIKEGTWSYQQLGSAMALTVEAYADVVLEAMKGPSYSVRPEWAYFCFQLSGRSGAMETEVPIELQPQDTKIEQTDFVDPIARFSIPGRAAPDVSIAYTQCELTRDRKAMKIALDVNVLKQAEPGTYTSLISAKGRTGQAPLVIVTLVIEG